MPNDDRSAEDIKLAERLAAMTRGLPDTRGDLVEVTKREIARGVYDTPGHIAIAAQRLADELQPSRR